MKLNVLISTIDVGLSKVCAVLLPPVKDVSYVIVHQYSSSCAPAIPRCLIRDDVVVRQVWDRGVTKSRNLAMDLADGDIGLFSDDDVRYRADYFEAVIKTFKANPDLAFAKFKIKTPDGEPDYQEYVDQEYEITRSENVGTIQIAVRLTQIREARVRFDTRFGAGSRRLGGGGEQVFLHDCLRSGLSAGYFPIYIVEHPYLSMAKSLGSYSARRVRVGGALDARQNGWVAIPKAVAGAFRYASDIHKCGSNLFSYMRYRLEGALYILTTRPDHEGVGVDS